ncbi:MAG: UvrD-helicase domain-containing protein, partial [Moorella sp. (in: Bacteria)]|nr:UvrD-helicase domain-containing protein [Moorella sp. (in: firmicutes)]
MIRWTTEQELAIKTRGGNLLVSAAAGTGKTAVLVERAIHLITEDGVDSDRLLVVTFTNAAAAEMKDRLRQALMDQIRKNPRAARLRSQLTLLNRACIGTIHSFCLNIIKQHFHLVGLDPRVRVAQEEEAALLRAEACEELFERRYDGARQDFLSLLDCLGGERGWSSLQELVLSLYKYAQNSPAP